MARPNTTLGERVARLEGKVSVLTKLNMIELGAVLSMLAMLLTRVV